LPPAIDPSPPTIEPSPPAIDPSPPTIETSVCKRYCTKKTPKDSFYVMHNVLA
jgi:hypothetical protein